MFKKKILSIGPTGVVQDILRDILKEQFDLIMIESAESAFQMACSENPNLIIVDLETSGLDGIKTCALLRNHFSTRLKPIFALTGNPDFDNKLRALEIGADDVLSKSVHYRELIARINSTLRRIDESRVDESKTLRFSDLELSLDRFECHIGGHAIALSVLEFNMLRHFVENATKVITREQLLRSAFRNSEISTRTVDVHMTSLRRKILGSQTEFVTLYSSGYVLKKRNNLAA